MALIGVVILTGCGKGPLVVTPPKPTPTALSINVSGDVNPTADGRPSPVVLRVYQLRGDGLFKGADYFPLADDEKKVLGQELIDRQEYTVTPSENLKVELPVAADAMFVGATAGFRDIRNAQWRALIPIARNGMILTVERTRVVLSAVE